MFSVLHLHTEHHPAIARSEPSLPCSDACFALAADCLRWFILTPVWEFAVHILIPLVCLVSGDLVSRCQNNLNKVSSLVWVVGVAWHHTDGQRHLLMLRACGCAFWVLLRLEIHLVCTKSSDNYFCLGVCVYQWKISLLSSSSVVSSSGPTTKTNCPSTTRWRFLVGIGHSSRQRSRGKSIKKNGPHTGATGPPNFSL